MDVASSRCRSEGHAHNPDPDKVCVFKRATCMNHKAFGSMVAATALTLTANGTAKTPHTAAASPDTGQGWMRCLRRDSVLLCLLTAGMPCG